MAMIQALNMMQGFQAGGAMGQLAGEIGNAMGGGGPGASQPKRFNGSIVIKNNRMQEMVRYTFKDAWAVSWEGPKLDSGNSSIAFETLEIAHHGLEVNREVGECQWDGPKRFTIQITYGYICISKNSNIFHNHLNYLYI